MNFLEKRHYTYARRLIVKGVELVAQLMAISAITAPKSKGENFVQVKTIDGQGVQDLGHAMIAYGQKVQKTDFDRDGKNVLNSDAVLLIGLKDAIPLGLNCGACGFEDCKSMSAHNPAEVEFKGPICALRLLDMGIAIGSAVKTASMLNVDNRVMYRVGAVARDMKIVYWDYVMGIPLSVSGKSIFFDR